MGEILRYRGIGGIRDIEVYEILRYRANNADIGDTETIRGRGCLA